MFRKLLDAQSKTLIVDHKVLSGDQTVRLHRIEQRDVPGRIPWSKVQTTEVINPAWFLCPRCERPRSGGTANKRDEFPSLHGFAPEGSEVTDA